MLNKSEIGFVAKIDVSSMAKSIQWYTEKLDLEIDPRFEGPYWNQLNIKNMKRFALGLSLAKPGRGIGSGQAVMTFVVDNIEDAKVDLEAKNVVVSEIKDVGQGVKLAFFNDPDKNALGLRQNSKSEPAACEIGYCE
ncbi:VOC family protein [uncultured Shewanella sp.]|uniref:VOC family protein n=1 Tax=uncultured Shewanella sp. TaxID=173975 RepID=UPI00260AECE4|nr:VOC family protein [uncultured Shewanella sp.]